MLKNSSTIKNWLTNKYSIAQLEKQLPMLLLSISEGVQLWDNSGHLLYANLSTAKHYNKKSIGENISYTDLLVHCKNKDGSALSNQQFPIVQVIETNQPSTEVIVKIRSKPRIWLQLNAYPLFDENNLLTGILSTSYEVSKLIEKSLRLEIDAHYDALTGLPNRLLLSDRIHMALSYSDRSGDSVAICMMDLDGFKTINDTLGHETGDFLLKEVSIRLQKTIREEDSAIRLGGDEFVLLIGGLKNETDCQLSIKRVLNAIALPFIINNKTIHITASLGVTLYPGDSSVIDQLLRHADQSMYKAKEKGKNCFKIYDPTLESRLRANQGLIKRIENALSNKQLVLYYQPKVDCSKGKIIGMEALIRWDHPVLGIRSPAEFLPLIEQDDLIIRIGDWLIDTVVKQLITWQNEGIFFPISINIAARHFLRGNFDKKLQQLASNYPLELLNKLEIEILETAALEDVKRVSALISRNKEKGIRFALDDFGTGYSSLVHLKHLDVNVLKIDQSFVQNMTSDPGDLAIIQGIIGLAEAFQVEVIAEGVETIEQTLLLIEMGCQVIQGFIIAHPMPAEKLSNWVNNFTIDPRWRTAHRSFPMRNDFDLLQMEVIHSFWLEKLKSENNNLDNRSKSKLVDYNHCSLTQWYKNVGLERYASLPGFHKIEALHREVHQLAKQLLGETTIEQNQEVSKQLSIANGELVSALHKFRRKISMSRLINNRKLNPS
jgi:diguanylate cyclase (GGDEF)-like protein